MRKLLGIVSMSLGALLLVGALGLFLWNRTEAQRAARSSADLIPQLYSAISQRTEQSPTASIQPGTPVELLPQEAKKMTEVEIDGHFYIGYLSIPGLGLELPVLSQWDYDLLKTAPCRYSGTTAEANLVLIAHNYRAHFGNLHQLQLGDRVMFTDMNGVLTQYQVAATDVVPPSSTEEVTAGAFDLALVTCTYGGKTRLVVYCEEDAP
ncbi:MAG: sortase [Ruminococcaceae bacterium]|nr:sortase [Oscillospiraceae bacterium]